MISEPLAKLLVAQVSTELGAIRRTSGSRSTSSERASIIGPRSSAISPSKRRSMLEDHAFLLDNEVEFDLPGLSRQPLTTSRRPTRSRLRSRADQGPRGSSMPWPRRGRGGRPSRVPVPPVVIDEQVEEERTMRGLLDLLASGINLFQAQELLDEIVEE